MDTKKSTMATPTLETFANQTQIFASAWSLINSPFGGEDSLERAEVERGILLDMARRLIEDHDAARQEIASLTAQHEGGKSEALADLAYAHGMTTGWNLCIADKHDEFARIRSMRSSQAISTIEAPPKPTAQPLHVAATSCPHEIDKDKIVLHFDSKQPGKNALAQLAQLAARLQAAQAQEDAGGWMRNGALLYRLTDECRPTNFDEIRVTMANGSRDIGQMSVQAERLLVMLTAPQPAAQAQEDVPDMFWDADDTENFAHEIQDIIDGYGPGEIVTIECAKRLPNLRVVVTRDGDGLSYEYLEAAIVAQEGGAHG